MSVHARLASTCAVAVFAGWPVASSMALCGNDGWIVNGQLVGASCTKFDPICRIGVIGSNNARVIASTGILVGPGVAIVNSDSVYNQNGQPICNYGGTATTQFLRFRRLLNGDPDDDANGVVYDVPITSVARLPYSNCAEAGMLVFFDPANLPQVAPAEVELDTFPTSTATDILVPGYGATTCGGGSPSTELYSYTTGISGNELYAAPDYYLPRYDFAIDDACICGSGGACPGGGRTGGDSGAPFVVDHSGVLRALVAGNSLMIPTAITDIKRVLADFSGTPVDGGSIALRLNRSITTRSNIIAANCVYGVEIPCDLPPASWDTSLAMTSGVHTYEPDAAVQELIDRHENLDGACGPEAGIHMNLGRGYRVAEASGKITVSIGDQHEKSASLSFQNHSYADLGYEARAAAAFNGRLMVRTPFSVTTSNYAWLAVWLQGNRVETGADAATPSASGQGYWIIIRDNDGDGLVDEGDRMVDFNGFGANGVRIASGPRRGVEIENGVTAESVLSHVMLPPGNYILECGIHTFSSISTEVRDACGTDTSVSGLVKENVMVTLMPDAICGSLDFLPDNFLDYADYDAFVAAFELGETDVYPTPDFNRDGQLDFFDYDSFVAAYLGSACDGSEAPDLVRIFE